MPAPPKPTDQLINLDFPRAGVDTTGQFEEQKPYTAAAAVNVRTNEALTRRARGGSRAGLVKFIPQTVTGT